MNKRKKMTPEQRLDTLTKFWLDAVIDAGLATLWLSGLAMRRVASVLEWVAARADPDEYPGDGEGTDD